VIGDGSCFVHALLQSYFQDTYTDMSNEKRKEFAKVVRKQVADSIDYNTFFELGKGTIAFKLISDKIYKKLSQSDRKEYDNIYNKINFNSESFFEDFTETISDKFPSINLLDDNGIYETCYNDYIKFLKGSSPSDWISQEYIECFSRYFKINIIIVKDISRDIFNYGELNPDLNSVIILNIDPIHYETIFRDQNDVVTFEFSSQDLLIKRLLNRTGLEIRQIQVEEEEEEEEVEEEEEEEKLPSIVGISIEPLKVVEETSEDLDEIKRNIKDIVDDYFLFTNIKINYEIE
jgi:hypothetical protein